MKNNNTRLIINSNNNNITRPMDNNNNDTNVDNRLNGGGISVPSMRGKLEKSKRRTEEIGVWITKMKTEGVFPVTTKNAFLPVNRVYSVNIYSRISTVP